MDEFVHETPEQKAARNRAQFENNRAAKQDKFVRQNGKNSKLEDALHGDLDPIYEVQVEKPIHRKMIEMLLQGYTHREIAAATGYHAHYVSNIMRQPYMRDRILQNVKKTVSEEIKEFLEGEALPSLKKLRDIRDNPLVPPVNQLSASNSLLDRFLGKPVQPITQEQKPSEELTKEELEQRVAAIAARVGGLEGISTQE